MLNMIPPRPPPDALGFTLIEMVLVIAIVGLLMATAAPATIRAMAKAKVGEAIGRIEQVAMFAQRKAQIGQVPDGIAPESAAHYGVAIFAQGGAWYATATYGLTPSDALADFKPLPLGSGFEVWTASDDAAQTETRLDDRLGWFYQFGSGYPILSPANQAAQAIGTPVQLAAAAEVSGTSGNYQIFGTSLMAIPRGKASGPTGLAIDCSGIRLRYAGQAPPLPFAAAFAVYPVGMLNRVVR